MLRIYGVCHARFRNRLVLAELCLWAWSGVLFVVVAPRLYRLPSMKSPWPGLTAMPPDRLVDWVGRQNGLLVGVGAMAAVAYLVYVVLMVVVILGSGYMLVAWLRGALVTRQLFPTLWKPKTFLSVRTLVAAVESCASAYSAGGERKAVAIAEVSNQVRKVSRVILRLSSTRGSLPWRSRRRSALRAHAQLVVGKLHAVEQELDRNPSVALRELAELLLTIAGRYAEGRIGLLLDGEDLEGVEPARARAVDAARAAIAVVLTVVAVFAVASLDLPQAIEGYAVAGSGVVVMVMVYGPQVIAEYRRRR
ncbi:hypothetical protein ACWCY1_24975 [Streptomyces goshikiensis]|uniref:hypothetical protein n=1 Tax=Streptomyces sp. CB03578 TaxID=1718987 RepID=UPI000B0536AA|nr:hypothetical protein [Streptomyces sp. CB03578]